MTAPKHPPRVWLASYEIEAFKHPTEDGTEYLGVFEHQHLLSAERAGAEETLLLKIARYCGLVENLEQMQRDMMAEYKRAKAAREGKK